MTLDAWCLQSFISLIGMLGRMISKKYLNVLTIFYFFDFWYWRINIFQELNVQYF